MYLRRCYRQKDGKRHAYWALVESYRTVRGPRQRVVACLGELDEQGRLGVQRAAQPDCAPQASLFDQHTSQKWVEMDLRGVRVERIHPLHAAFWTSHQLECNVIHGSRGDAYILTRSRTHCTRLPCTVVTMPAKL